MVVLARGYSGKLTKVADNVSHGFAHQNSRHRSFHQAHHPLTPPLILPLTPSLLSGFLNPSHSTLHFLLFRETKECVCVQPKCSFGRSAASNLTRFSALWRVFWEDNLMQFSQEIRVCILTSRFLRKENGIVDFAENTKWKGNCGKPWVPTAAPPFHINLVLRSFLKQGLHPKPQPSGIYIKEKKKSNGTPLKRECVRNPGSILDSLRREREREILMLAGLV